jgi:choline dehydrogenase-like flavoprotein
MSSSFRCYAACAALILFATTEYHAQPARRAAIASRAEIVVFGATPGGVAAAVSAARAKRKVLLLEPGSWVGGMMSGGLSNTDTGQRGAEVISGLAGEFFRRVRAIGESRGACLDDCSSTFFFEPHVAERVFEEMLRETGVVV